MLEYVRGGGPFGADSIQTLMMREPPFPCISDPRLLGGTMTAPVATSAVGLIRNDRVRAAIIAHQSHLQADLAEFSRGISDFQDYNGLLISQLERARTRPDAASDDAPVAALLALRGNVETAIVLRLISFNISNRVWYVGQMLDATNVLAAAFAERS